MKNIILMDFKNEPEAYESYMKIKDTQISESYVYEAAIVKVEDGDLEVLDSYNLNENTGTDTLTGGIVGAVIGLFTGPFGWLFWGIVGILVGDLLDNHNDKVAASLLHDMSNKIKDGNVNVLAVVDEKNLNVIDNIVATYDVVVMRYDYDQVQEEIKQAKHMNKEIAKEAKKKAHEAKKKARKENKNSK